MRRGKTRVVSCRLSEAEYQHLMDVCIANGARTRSDIARQLFCSLMEDDVPDTPEALMKRITQLNRNVIALIMEIRTLASMVRTALLQVREADRDVTTDRSTT